MMALLRFLIKIWFSSSLIDAFLMYFFQVWDSRVKLPVMSFSNTFQVTAVAFSEGDDQVFSGGIDNVIKVFPSISDLSRLFVGSITIIVLHLQKVWDIRKKETAYKLVGHTDTITGLRLSPDGAYLLSNSMDETRTLFLLLLFFNSQLNVLSNMLVKMWDIKPFAQANRLLKTFEGAPHGNEKQLIRCGWSPDGSRICAGAGDRTVLVWDVATRRILYKLPGHKGCVIDCDFHPKEPISLLFLSFLFFSFLFFSFLFFSFLFFVLKKSIQKFNSKI